MKVVHLINRRVGVSLQGLSHLNGRIHRSCCWAFSEAEARSLIGGWIFLHPIAKSEPSEFGGVVKNVEPATREGGAIKDGFAFIFEAKPEGRGQPWRGADHTMAWTSGIIEVPDIDSEQD